MALTPYKNCNRSFYKCIRLTLLVCKFFGWLPISGLLKKTGDSTRYHWKSFYTIFHAASFVTHFVYVGLFLHDRIISESYLKEITGHLFHLITISSSVCLTVFSVKFRKMLDQIEMVEDLLPPLRTTRIVVRTINKIAISMFLACLGEHVLFFVSSYVVCLVCYPLSDDSGLYIKSYFVGTYSWYYRYATFSYWPGIVFQISKLQIAFVWMYTDIFVIIVTLYLITRVKQFNGKLRRKQKKCLENGEAIPWSTLQAHYTRLTRLVLLLDDHVNKFVLISFTTQLVFISKKIYDILKDKDVLHYVSANICPASHRFHWLLSFYLCYTTIFLLLKGILILFMVAHLNTISRESLDVLHAVPPAAYTKETQRFVDQVFHSKICLSGYRFFYVTKGTILTVISSLITYELLMFQMPKEF